MGAVGLTGTIFNYIIEYTPKTGTVDAPRREDPD